MLEYNAAVSMDFINSLPLKRPGLDKAVGMLNLHKQKGRSGLQYNLTIIRNEKHPGQIHQRSLQKGGLFYSMATR
ncbi:hypothetical protein C900_01297 [Fulvivirga imtechensis AK7]|uniref:Uncharacterized protein n=1 Tax=Fulvivirga imtechensis AK7 TaxID=1237149 RepID=L8JY00_9BACT|nr:hypothetical protein C900_01297 [Fulvivirga imtechensis AK7]